MRSSVLILVTVSLFIAIAMRIPPSNEAEQSQSREPSTRDESTGEESTLDLAVSDGRSGSRVCRSKNWGCQP